MSPLTSGLAIALASASGRRANGRQQDGIHADERPLAGEHVTGARQTQPVTQRGNDRHNQSFQPEWIATAPPLRRVQSTRGEAGGANHVGEQVWRRKLADRFDEIAVGRAVARHHLAEKRNDGEGIGVVDPVEQRQVDAAEFEAQEAAAAPDDPIGFGERLFDPRHVADAEGDRVGVETRIGERQRLGVGFDETHPIGQGALAGALDADPQHVGVDVGDRHRSQGAAGPGDAEGDIARAAGDIEMGERAHARGVDLGGENVLP